MSDNEPSQVVRAGVTSAAITLSDHEELAGSDWAGAVVGFGGVVRNHDGGRAVTKLEYEGHPQAGEFMTGIAAVASAHRAEAFTACAELVETIKSNLPIWKNQFFTDGTQEWVGSL